MLSKRSVSEVIVCEAPLSMTARMVSCGFGIMGEDDDVGIYVDDEMRCEGGATTSE